MYNNYQKSHRGIGVSSFPSVSDRKPSPQSSRCSNNAKQFFQSNDLSRMNVLKSMQNQIHYSTQQSTVHENTILGKMRKRNQNDQISKLSIEQLNIQIQNNMNQIINLYNKRKMLVNQKKRKLKQQTNSKNDNKISNNKNAMLNNNLENLSQDEQLSKLSCLMINIQTSTKILNNLINIMPNLDDKRNKQQQKSMDFWTNNQKYQQQIDSMLTSLKQIDFKLQKQTNQVGQICRTLDNIQQTLKDLLIKKQSDHLKKAQPLFINKKKTYDLLNVKISERQKIKDEKIQYVKKIRQYLVQLKMVRQNRKKQIYELFDIHDSEVTQNKINYYNDCAQAIEQLLNLKEKSDKLKDSQKQLQIQIENVSKSEVNLLNELIKKQNDEFKAYQNYDNLIKQRNKYNNFLGIFNSELSFMEQNNFIEQEYLQNLRCYRQILKAYAQQDRLIKQGLIKTTQTYKTFTNILKATQNEKQRRKQLLNLIESCSKLKNEQQSKKDQLRNMAVQIAKKTQQKNHIEQQLQNMITDGDLQSYKKVGIALNKCENEIQKLGLTKKMLQSQIQTINKQIYEIATNLKHEYQDILKDILPTNFQFNLKTSDDIKQIKNYLRKTYKRLGLINTEQ